jgi:hypothetical protein
MSSPVRLAFVTSVLAAVVLSGCSLSAKPEADFPTEEVVSVSRTDFGALQPVDDVFDAMDTHKSGAPIGAAPAGSDHVYSLPGFSAYGTADIHTLEREYVTRPVGGVFLVELNPFASSAN